MIRLIDIVFASFVLLVFSPFFLLVSLILVLSPGTVFYTQWRVGKNGKDFKLFKFRTMIANAESHGLLTVGGRDSRITKLGFFLRKYKLDELPQLINILRGEMSFVGPRPEVRKYVDLYTKEQLKVLDVKPGLTDLASLKYFNENELLAQAENPEEFYIQEVMPEKIRLNMEFILNPTWTNYWKIIFMTIFKVFKNK